MYVHSQSTTFNKISNCTGLTDLVKVIKEVDYTWELGALSLGNFCSSKQYKYYITYMCIFKDLKYNSGMLGNYGLLHKLCGFHHTLQDILIFMVIEHIQLLQHLPREEEHSLPHTFKGTLQVLSHHLQVSQKGTGLNHYVQWMLRGGNRSYHKVSKLNLIFES